MENLSRTRVSLMLRYKITLYLQIYYHNSVFSSQWEKLCRMKSAAIKTVLNFYWRKIRRNIVSRDNLRLLAIGYGAEHNISPNTKRAVSLQTGHCSLQVLL